MQEDRYVDPSVGEFQVWTGTGPNGLKMPNDIDCGDWTSTSGFGGVGLYEYTDDQWTMTGLDLEQPCNRLRHLYCFQQ